MTRSLAGFSMTSSFLDPRADAAALTLHAEPVGAVLGVEHPTPAILATVARSWRRALAAAPVGALSAAC